MCIGYIYCDITYLILFILIDRFPRIFYENLWKLCHLWIALLYWLWLPVWCWIVLRMNTLALLLTLVEKHSPFSMRCDVSCWDFFVDALYWLRKFPSITFLRVFVMSRCWVLSNPLSVSTDMIMWFFFFRLFKYLNQLAFLA